MEMQEDEEEEEEEKEEISIISSALLLAFAVDHIWLDTMQLISDGLFNAFK